MLMRRAYYAIAAGLLGALTLAGCETTGQSNSPATTSAATTDAIAQTIPAAASLVQQKTSNTTKPTNQIRDLPWIDGDVFDRQLSGALKQNPSEVRVDMEAPMRQMPQRMNTWLNEVSERGGNVNAMPQQAWDRMNAQQTAEVKTRAAFLLQLIPIAVQYIAERVRTEATYGPSGNYDVILVTNNQRDRVQLVVFKHKNAE
jgi:hypothetical protein